MSKNIKFLSVLLLLALLTAVIFFTMKDSFQKPSNNEIPQEIAVLQQQLDQLSEVAELDLTSVIKKMENLKVHGEIPVKSIPVGKPNPFVPF